MNANEIYPIQLMRKCLLVMLILMLVILMLILMLLNLKTDYADTDADLCIRIMSLYCTNYEMYIPVHKESSWYTVFISNHERCL